MSPHGEGTLRAEDIFYAVALAILMGWLVLSSGVIAPHGSPASISTAAPETAPAAAPTAERPRVVAEVTLDTERFYILVGEGPPSFGVAVGAGDAPPHDASGL
jgi:hypothetical protein